MTRTVVPPLNTEDPVETRRFFEQFSQKFNALSGSEHRLSDYVSFSAAITAIGTTDTTLFVDSDDTISADTTVPSTLALRRTNGKILIISSGITLTINGPHEAGDWQCFSGAGSVVFSARMIYTEWWGAVADGSTDCTAEIQDAIDSLSSGGFVQLLAGTYLISVGGTEGARDYGIMLKSNRILQGLGSGLTVIKADANTDMDVITDDRSTQTTDIELYKFKIDGNEANQTDGGFNLWIKNSDRFSIDDVSSFNTGSWGFRFEQITNMTVGVLYCDHTNESNSDGIHMVDCSYVVIDKLIIDTLGDDGFIIEAINDDSHDISVGEIVVNSTVTAGSRAVLLLVDETVAGAQRNIYNISMPNIVTHDNTGASGAGLVLGGGNYYNIEANIVSYNSRVDLYLNAGSATYAGFIRNCKFTVKSWNPAAKSVEMVDTYSTIERNMLDLQSYNPADGQVGCTLKGDLWIANIQMDYDPNGTKSSQSHGIDIHGSNSIIHASVDGANKNLYLRATADDNVIYLGLLDNAVTADIEVVVGGNYNKFYGGKVTGTVTDGGTGNKFFNIAGYVTKNSGTGTFADTETTDVITHGLGVTPAIEDISIIGREAPTNNIGYPWIDDVGATTFRVNIADPGGSGWDYSWLVDTEH